jgi:LmbE family N-acetylglucosaminyl deacetylase
MLLASLFLLGSADSWAGSPPSALIIVAHPDDEYCLAATTFRMAQELHGLVDQLVITDGESGYKYSGPSEHVYGKNFALTSVRKEELERAGKILGIRHHVYLDQPDFGFTENPDESLKKWDRKKINQAILKLLRENHYDAVLTLLPTPTTHGQHKAAAIFALDTVSSLNPGSRPLVLGCSNDSDTEDTRRFVQDTMMRGYPETRVSSVSLPPFDRSSSFGFKNQLSYQIYVNWMVAEHKSQGLFQTYFNRDKLENFYLFDSGNPNDAQKAVDFMKSILPPRVN